MRRALLLAALAIAAALPVMGSKLHAQQPPSGLQPGKHLGFAYEPVSDGAMIKIVAEGSAAARAGLKPGMVVTRLNGIPLGALDGKRMQEMFESAPDDMTLVVTPLGWVKISRSEIAESDRAAFNAKAQPQ
jgi:S1-C subfamily serine protease